MISSIKKMWFMAAKDLKVFATDPRALAFGIAFPIALIFFSINAFGGAGGADPVLQLYVATEEAEDGISHQVIEHLQDIDDLNIDEVEYAAAVEAFEDERLDAFIAFEEDFTDAVMAGYGTQIKVYAQPEAGRSRAALVGIANEIARRVGKIRTVMDGGFALMPLMYSSDEMTEMDMQRIVGMFDGIFAEQQFEEASVGMHVEQVGDIEPPGAPNWAVAGYVVMFIFFTAALGSEAIVRERDNATLQRLVVSGVGEGTILGAKMLGTALRATLQALLLWGVGIFVFGIDIADTILPVLLITFAFIFVSSAFSIMIASRAKTDNSANSAAVLASLIAAPVGGCWWPLFVAPGWLQDFAKITPHAWANDALNRVMLYGADTGDVMIPLLVLLMFGTAFFAVGAYSFDARSKN